MWFLTGSALINGLRRASQIYPRHHKVRTYKEYHSVCPSSDFPQPPTPWLVCPSPLFLGGGEHSLARKGLGESYFRRGAYTVVLFICTYFVLATIKYGMALESSLYRTPRLESNLEPIFRQAGPGDICCRQMHWLAIYHTHQHRH